MTRNVRNNYDVLFLVFLAYIILLRIPLTILKLYNISYFYRESRATYMFTILSEIFQMAWTIYANVIYYSSENRECRFYIVAGIFMLYVYYVLYKICIFILVAIILIPWFIISYINDTRNRRKDAKKMKKLISKLVTIKFKPEEHDPDAEWTICLDYFKEEEDLIILPCDERHYFHSQCVKTWLKRNLICPLWKDDVSISKINNQLVRRRSTVSTASSQQLSIN